MVRLLLFCFLSIAMPVAAQRLSYWNQSCTPDNQVFFSYENDFFVQRDQYYSQGISVGYRRYLKPDLNPGTKRLRRKGHTVGFAAEHQVFTPSTIRSDSALYGDRPYAALMRGTLLFETGNMAKKSDFGYSGSIGFMGPAANGREMQTAIHKATNNSRPLGWQYQLPWSVLIDFAFRVKKQVYCYQRWLTIDGFSTVNAGTTNNDLSGGLQLRFALNLKGVILTCYANPAVRFVGYDGTLQGAFFSKESVVSISAADLKRVVFEQEVGIQLMTKKWKFNHWYRFQSPVFNGASAHSWGGVSICYPFKQ